MTAINEPASEAELVTFLEKLAQFHTTLSPREQLLLDDLTAAALMPPAGEVEGYTVPPLLQTLQTVNLPTSTYYGYYKAVLSLQAQGATPLWK